MARILVVDDEVLILNVLKAVLRSDGHEPVAVNDGKQALDLIQKDRFDLMISDIRMTPIDGIELLKQVRPLHPALPVIMMTGYGTVKSAVDALSLNVFDYIPKPFKVDDFLETVRQALSYGQTIAGDDAADGMLPACKIGSLIAVSAKMLDVCSMIQKLSPVDVPIVITGEFGCGREIVAETIHGCSSRKESPFLSIPCSDLQEPLAETMLFGAKAPDGESASPGVIERAKGGTLFLKDVNQLPPAPLGRLIEQIHREADGTSPGKTTFPVRLIGGITDSTDPEEQKRSSGLFHKLGAVELHVPPLRERREDILPLVIHLLRKQRGNDKEIPTLSADIRMRLKHYDWPGNVREMCMAVEYIMAHLDGGKVSHSSLPAELQEVKAPGVATKDAASPSRQKSLKSFLSKPLLSIKKPAGGPAPGPGKT